MLRLKKFFLFFVFLGMIAAKLFAEEGVYDRYASIWQSGPLKEKPSSFSEALKSFGAHFLVYPFELLRWPTDKALIWTEKYHLDDKTTWLYNQMTNHGFTPHFIDGPSLSDGFGGGLSIELIKLLGLKERLPNTSIKGSAVWTTDFITEYQASIKQERIADTEFWMGGGVKYENRGDEHFYGIGPNSSKGDGTDYRMERTTLDVTPGFSFLNTWHLQGKFAYQNVNITNGEDGGRGIIDPIFVQTGRQTIPGLAGDQILSWGLDLEHDNRDNPDRPTEGGYERFHFSYHKGIESDSGYFKYRGEIGHFFKIFSERRVLALRAVVEQNDELSNREVPFFDLARLGGYGIYPRYGDTHRGYTRERFYDESLALFNLEYRWTALEYRNWRLEPVVFWDVGQVFGEWSRFQFNDFRSSYGGGVRLHKAEKVLLTFEMAKSNEGMEFYAATKAPF